MFGPNFKKVLAVAPHTDDVELGCGGTLARALDEGAEVFVAALSTVEDSVPEGKPSTTLRDEFLASMELLGVPSSHLMISAFPVRRLGDYRQEILDSLLDLRRQVQPDLVLGPASSDVHQDHQVVYSECLRAFKDLTLLGYEAAWNHVTFSATAFVILEYRHLEVKWRSLSAYESQFALKRPYFTREFIDGLARVRGVQVKAEFAEAFEAVRVRL